MMENGPKIQWFRHFIKSMCSFHVKKWHFFMDSSGALVLLPQ